MAGRMEKTSGRSGVYPHQEPDKMRIKKVRETL